VGATRPVRHVGPVYSGPSGAGVTMRISCSKRFILLHLPRTGVSSIIAALDDALFVRAAPTLTNKLMSKYVSIVPRPIEKTYFRAHERAVHVRRLVPKTVFERYRKIAFVRNPYSWLVSLYELVLQSPNHRHYERVQAMSGFGEYVDWEIGRRKRDQHRYVLDYNGRMMVDEIGRFERLGEDAARIFGALGVELEPLPRVGQLTRRDYREFYDATSRRKVETHWARDLALFGYDFDGLIGRGGKPLPPEA
jgi:Sulfotransferase family